MGLAWRSGQCRWTACRSPKQPLKGLSASVASADEDSTSFTLEGNLMTTTVDATRESGYEAGKSMQQVADEWAESLLKRARTRELNQESAYGGEVQVFYDITIAGGGPAAVVRFEFESDANPEYLFDYEPLAAELRYFEWFTGAVTHRFSGSEAALLWQRFYANPEQDALLRECADCGELFEPEDQDDDSETLCDDCKPELAE